MFEFDIKHIPQNESEYLEYKESGNKLPADVWKSVSAFANTEGGSIILGIKELKNHRGSERFVISGVADPNPIIEQFWTKASDKAFLSYNPVGNSNLQVHQSPEGLAVIQINVPSAPDVKRPVCLHGDNAQSYKRVGTADVKMNSDDVGILLSDRRTSMDEKPLPGYDLDDIDPVSVAQFQAEMRKNPKYETIASLPMDQFLRLVNVLVPQRDGSNRKALTAGGLLFFGKYQSIIQAFPRFQVEYYDKTDLLAETRYTDRVSTLTDMLNIWGFFQQSFPKLLASVKNTFRLDEQMKRIETGALLEVAIREALVNTLMHANYFQGEPITISNTLNYYDFLNPGKMLVTPEEFFSTLKSKARNSIISALFVRIGLGERSGTGGGLIVKSAMEARARLPEVETELGKTKLRIWKADYATSLDGIDLDKDSKNIIKVLSQHARLKKTEIRELTGMTRSKADLRLRTLVDAKIIEKHGQSRATYYTIPMTFIQAIAQIQQQSEVVRDVLRKNHQQNNK